MTIESTNSTDEMTDEIPLDPSPAPTTTTTTSAANTTGAAVDDNDDEVDALLDELKQPNEQEIAVEKLKLSTSKLQSAIKNVSTDIDSKLAISQKAKNVDANLGISKTASSTVSAVGSFFNKLQIKERAMDVVNSETVRNVSYSVSDTLEKTGVKGAVLDGAEKVKKLDEQHKITAVTAETLAEGVNWFTESLNKVSSSNKPAQGDGN